MDIIAMGRSTVDLYANEIGPLEQARTFTKYVGGSPANTAVAMANLGLKVGYIGKVSDDGFGRFVRSYLKEKNVDVSHLLTDHTGKRCGVTIGEILENGRCGYFMYRNECADLNMQCKELDEAYIAGAKALLISGTSLTASPAREAVFMAIEMAKRNKVSVILDLDYRENTWSSMEEASVYYHLAACASDMVIATREEFDVMERLYLPENKDDEVSADYLLERGVSLVSIKRGRGGSAVYEKGTVHKGGIYPVNALKTFGAGDAYSGGFHYGMLRGFSIEDSLKYAAAAASITISGHSCSDSTPTLAQVEAFMREHVYRREA